MPAPTLVASAFEAPQVSQAEIDLFHEAHFSEAALASFDHRFLRPERNAYRDSQEQAYDVGDEFEEEDDGLGYYPDGAKRTLTDEQIAIFRHSEMEALRRTADARLAEHKINSVAMLEIAEVNIQEDTAEGQIALPLSTELDPATGKACEVKAESGSEDGEIETPQPQLTAAEAKRLKRKLARRRKQEKKKFQPEKQPDLRKRTWDAVETGMDKLDYDDLEMETAAGANTATQRRRISYDD